SAAALAIARHNASHHGLSPQRLALREGHWWQAVGSAERFDLIVSNPPYIADTDPHLVEGDLRFEPITALASGPDGLNALREIAMGAPAHLASAGWLAVEHGWNQGAAVRALFTQAGLADVRTRRDLAGHERVTLGCAP
ncbi:MAG: N5-glutamine methyltransferase family protein, partial [Betaproteobacteria bacterium]